MKVQHHNIIKKTGFTLVELLVTIAILGILSALGIVMYTGVTGKAKDTQRIKDLQTIKRALEFYRADARFYPPTSTFILDVAGVTLTYGTNTYLSSVPTDVNSPNRNYYYLALPSSPACDNTSLATACTGFVLCAKKESINTPDFTDCSNLNLNKCGTSGNCDIGVASQ